MTISQPRLTVADLTEMPEDGKRYELLEGELVVSPAPTPSHQRAVFNMGVFLRRAEDAGLGLVYVAPLEVYFDEENDTQPDVFFVVTPRLDIVKEGRVEGAPDLVVEVLSPSTRRRDLRGKMHIYARFGVPHYWIVDLRERTVQPHELTARGYAPGPVLRGDESLSCPLFPGITIAAREIFR